MKRCSVVSNEEAIEEEVARPADQAVGTNVRMFV
jgi:hypothetical protein